jgi:chromosome segregation ATPase
VRQEIERRLHEKDEEFENTRRNHQRAIESMQASLEAETKGKAEALRQKKKLEGDINELEISLDHSNRTNADLQKANKKLQQTITELESQIEDEQRQRDEAREAVNLAERRCNILISELDELRLSLEQAERSRKAAEIDLHDAADRISDLGSSNANLTALKRQLEGNLAVLQADLDEAIHELKNSEERLKKASSDAARLAEELRHEQVILFIFENFQSKNIRFL